MNEMNDFEKALTLVYNIVVNGFIVCLLKYPFNFIMSIYSLLIDIADSIIEAWDIYNDQKQL